MYQPKTGQKCSCKSGSQRDNCSNCEGTGQVIDFRAIRAKTGKLQLVSRMLKDANIDPELVSPNFVADFAYNRNIELTSNEVVSISNDY